MGGGHGPKIAYNANNFKQTDEEMLGQIQRIDTIKHSPNHWHMNAFDTTNMYNIMGGAPTLAFGGAGAAISYAYYAGFAATRQVNFYAHNMRVFSRLVFGLTLGLAVGYQRFGDRQRLHNAWVAERLRRRYPESMDLHHQEGELYKLKNVIAPHDFYRWH